MRVAYVIVRYGSEVLGGAEQGCRMLAERVARRSGWSVEVFTTCALEADTWADCFPPGVVELNGVTVHRFRSQRGRDPGFEAMSRRVLRDPARASADDQRRWIDLQGPVCPDTVEAAARSAADVVVFYPYLYWPTVHGIPLVSGRAVMHPAAHDEAPLRLPQFADTFGAVRGLVFQTDSERRLAERLFASVAATPQLQLGLGVEERSDDGSAFVGRWGLDDTPYILCLGRVDDGKGAALLASYFTTYKARHPGPLKLVFAGPIINHPAEHDDIVTTGRITDDDKWGALHQAKMLISPSPNEAFSIALMEAWIAGLPVVVHGRCQATLEHARRSGGGLPFTSYATFEVTIEQLMGDPALRHVMGARGRAYVQQNFSWDQLITRYCTFLERRMTRGLNLARGAGRG